MRSHFLRVATLSVGLLVTAAPVTLEDGRIVDAWAYFYNAPLGRAERIHSGDYLEHLKIR